MIQEYLFVDDTHRSKVEEYTPEKVSIDIENIENSSCWTVAYSMDGENEDTAKILSQINDYVITHFSPTVLSNESASYFTQRLYPLVNEFERKLRKLLYLKSAIYSGEKKIDNIHDLESKDLGAIFELLFTDTEFIKSAKNAINTKSWSFTKKELLSTLQDIREDTIWNSLLGENVIRTLSNNFLTVKKYRNDVMHAHNIDAKTYRNAQKLFIEINKQLDVEIGLVLHTAEIAPTDTSNPAFNDALSSALKVQNMYETINQIQHYVESVNQQRQTIGAMLQKLGDSAPIPVSPFEQYLHMQESLQAFASQRQQLEHQIKQQVYGSDLDA